jgi:hypothetical protein
MLNLARAKQHMFASRKFWHPGAVQFAEIAGRTDSR